MLVRLPKNPDDTVTLRPLHDFRRPEQREDWIKPMRKQQLIPLSFNQAIEILNEQRKAK